MIRCYTLYLNTPISYQLFSTSIFSMFMLVCIHNMVLQYCQTIQTLCTCTYTAHTSQPHHHAYKSFPRLHTKQKMQNVQICASRLGKKRTMCLPIPKIIFFQFRVASNNLGKCGGREEEDLKWIMILKEIKNSLLFLSYAKICIYNIYLFLLLCSLGHT